MRILKNGLVLLMLTVLVLFYNQETNADVFSHHLRVTQPDSHLPFDGKFDDGTGAAIRFILSDKADSLWVRIYNGATLIRTIGAANYTAKDSFVVWDGKNTAGQFVGTGSYNFEVKTANAGYTQYTTIYYDQPAIFTRGVTAVKNPALKNFGFIYTAGNGGYVTGVARHAANGTQFGDVPGAALLTTTGAVVGPSDLRFSSEADNDGYIYLIGRTNRQIFRYHTDSLNVYMIDSSGYNTPLNGLAVYGSGAQKWLYVIGDTTVYGMNIGTNHTWFQSKQRIVSTTGAGITMTDGVVGRDGSIFVTFWTAGDSLTKPPGLAKFLISPTLRTFVDTVWTFRLPGGRAATTAIHYRANQSDDIIYVTQGRVASGNPAVQSIYALRNVYTNSPIGVVAYQDLQNNITTIRSDITVDAVGNLIFFENSNEEVVVIAPPFGPNNYTTAGLTPIKVVTAETIAAAKIDANGDFIPDRIGQTITVVGVVNSINFTASANRFSYYIQDGTGGINITKGTQPGGGPVYNIGVRILVTGVLGQFRGTTQLDIVNLATDIQRLDSNNTLTPVQLSIPQYLAQAERYEGMFIEIMAVAKRTGSVAWPTTAANASMTVHDGFNSLNMFVDLDAAFHTNPEPTYPVHVKGIGTQFTSSATVYNDGYQISPRFYTDFTQSVAAPPSPFFFLNTPANNATITVTDSNQIFTARWSKAVDLNNDPIVYQFVLLKSPVYSSPALTDTVFTFNGKQVLTWLAGADTLKTKWTVRAKGAEATIVASVDTFNVTFRKNLVGITDVIPTQFYVEQNYPNPFNPATTIKFGLPSDAQVDVRVFNILGQQVAVLVNNQFMRAGNHDVNFNAAKLASGTYIYRISTGNNVVTKKMILMK